MRIGISAEWIGERVGGPETYDRRLIDALGRVDRRNQYRIYVAHEHALEDWTQRPANFAIHRFRLRSRWFVISVGLTLALLRRPVDVFHATFVAPPWCPGRLVLTLHDVVWATHPQFLPRGVRLRLSALTARGVRAARKILVGSHVTKADVVRVFGVPEEKIVVTPYGVDDCFRAPTDSRAVAELLHRKYGLPTGYLLYVGRFHARKNLERLLRAFAAFIGRTKAGPPLVLAGREMWNETPLEKIVEELGLRDKVVFLGYVPDADLPALYAGARVFLFPSLFEGFGFTPLEAMACGTPVLAAPVSCMPEVLGNAPLWIDPYDVESIADGIARLVSSDALRDELTTKGAARAQAFSWHNMAEATLAVYEEVAAAR